MIFKYKRRKDYRRKKGHRQQFTLVRIEDIKGAPVESLEQEVLNNGT